MINAYRETELPIGDPDHRRKYSQAITESQAILTICMTLGMKVKTQDEARFAINVLRILELIILNDEAAELAIYNGRL